MKQNTIHEPWGGIVPKLAAIAHESNIDKVIQSSLDQAEISLNDLTAIAVTRGPGLAACLNVGLRKAISLSMDYKLPLVPVNHMEGHALISRLDQNVSFPFLTLLISGGHTQILVCKGIGDYVLLGETLDIAIGDVYDKVARTLRLSSGVFGGRDIELAASQGNPKEYSLTLPMKRNKNCDFSFSGIQTAVNMVIEHNGGEDFFTDPQRVFNLAASFQHICCEHILDRLDRAFNWCKQNDQLVAHFVVSGGVASNNYLRKNFKRFANRYNMEFVVPPAHLCTDNAIMIAWAGFENYRLGMNIEHNPEGLRYIPKWPLDKSKKNYFPYTRSSHIISTSTEKRAFVLEEFDSKFESGEVLSVSSICKAVKIALSLFDFEKADRYCNFGLERYPDQLRFENLKKKVQEKERSYKNKFG